MRMILGFLVTCLLVAPVSAEPKMDGTPTELKAYFEGQQGEKVVLAERATRVVRADRAQVRLRVTNSESSITKTMEANSKTLAELTALLKERGIEEQSIQTAWVSSLPLRSIQGKSTSSYDLAISHTMRVEVSDNQRFGAVLAAAERFKDVTIEGATFTYSKSAEARDELLKAALEGVARQKQTLETTLKVRLTPISFMMNHDAGEKVAPAIDADAMEPRDYVSVKAASFFGNNPQVTPEMNVALTVHVHYRLTPN